MNNGSANFKCSPGTYADAGNTSATCTVCPAGKACPETTSSASVIDCPSGTYSLQGQVRLLPLLGNGSSKHFSKQLLIFFIFVCRLLVNLAQLVTNVQTLIPRVRLVHLVSSPMVELPLVRLVRQVRFLICILQFVSAFSFDYFYFTSIFIVSTGHACDSHASDSTRPCPSGYFALVRTRPGVTGPLQFTDMNCKIAPMGTRVIDPTTTPQDCPPGTWSPPGSTSCPPCPAGFACLDPKQTPTLCALGYYSLSGATVCSPCTSGYLCPPGSTVAAPLGAECPSGTYCSDATPGVVTRCPAGTRGFVAGARSQAEGCEVCPEGFFCPQGSTRESTQICPGGHYCPQGTGIPVACPDGYYNNLHMQVSSGSCIPCLAGYSCPQGSTNPQPCPAGYYCPGLTGQPVPCPVGFYGGERMGLETVGECYTCPAGHYCNGTGNRNPTPCPAGQYQPDSNMGSCIPCPSGWACPYTGTSVLTVRCAQVRYLICIFFYCVASLQQFFHFV